MRVYIEYRVPDSVRLDQVQITDIPQPVPVHLWLDHTIITALLLNNAQDIGQVNSFLKNIPRAALTSCSS